MPMAAVGGVTAFLACFGRKPGIFREDSICRLDVLATLSSGSGSKARIL